jgi:5-methylthioadenosine/S-adenosylhomocysteine deaminase
MGGEVALGAPIYTQSWQIGRQLGLQIAAHILSPFSIRPILDCLPRARAAPRATSEIGPDNLST